MKNLFNYSLACCCATLLLMLPAPAQKKTSRAGARKTTPAAAPKKVVKPAPEIKAAPVPTPTPKPTPAPEPFAGASVEKMATACVALETEAGRIEMQMLPETAPETVRNFLNLVASGALDTTTFSRVVKNFVVQGGNLSTRETMTPEIAARSRRTILDEPNPVKHVRGIVSMARPDTPNAATTNFFILVSEASPHLDGTFAAFARVTSGLEVADAINAAALEDDKPVAPVRLKRAIINSCRSNPSRRHLEVERCFRQQ
jgi:peptidyl-prolyl cis-trans isomerase B (cyclophilin B)